jgi:hypothetical protein
MAFLNYVNHFMAPPPRNSPLAFFQTQVVKKIGQPARAALSS